MKPFKGDISNWKFVYLLETVCILGKSYGHRGFTGWRITSPIVAILGTSPNKIHIETKDSRYDLIVPQRFDSA